MTRESGRPVTARPAEVKPDGLAPAILTRGLSRSFGGRPALESLDLTVGSGEMFCIVGPDGAGKSTTVRLLCGILEPTAGDANILGLSLTRDADAIRTKVGYLSQAFTLYGDLTVDENIEFFASLHGVRDFSQRRNELLEFSRLTGARGRLAGNLSGGMKKKLALACTLIHTPAIVFLDEPSTGVDPVSRGEFWSILSDILAQGITVVLTTPYLDEAERCDRVAMLHRGRLVRVGSPDEIRACMPGVVFTISCDRPREAYAVLRSRWPSTNVVLTGGAIRFWSAAGRSDVDEAARLLGDRGHGCAGITEAEPTLDDVFVALLSERGEAGEADAEGRAGGGG
ncbi:MAG: ABC transporter ATP-binding protein [Candidatus Eisenbacteria bacterium]|nr:ABC transporter ATP-binding protein [Candidatus Eisenbacteria bacterium]